MDSFVFWDDNPVERSKVKRFTPEVEVIEPPEDVSLWPSLLKSIEYFSKIKLTKEDLKKHKQYKQRSKFVLEKNNSADESQYLKSINLNISSLNISSQNLSRASQLTLKTNQFNLTTKKYTTGEINNIANNHKYIKIYGKLIDKHGDNGLIAITIGQLKYKQCHIDLWLMSCRVLKRDMEFVMLDELVARCREKGIFELIGYYNKSVKNSMVSDLYEKFGFELYGRNGENTIWKLNIENYENKNKFIGVVSE